MEAALINIQQIKHGFSKSNDACLSSIVPALLSEIASLMTEEMKQKQRLAVITEWLNEFSEMLSSFMSGQDDEENVVYLVAQGCNKQTAMLGTCFHLIMGLLYEKEIVSGQAILEWMASAKQRIEEGDPEPEEAKGEDEDDQQVPCETLTKFVSGMSKLEEYIQSLQGEAAGGDEEYYDEEEGEEGY